MRRRRAVERRIFFPWEGRGGLLRWLGLGRFRPVVLVLVVVGIIAVVGLRERRAVGLRQTRAALLSTRVHVENYLIDHDGGCPPNLTAVIEHAGKERVPEDAWGRPLRLICPGRWEGERFQLMSDGPDRIQEGLDQIH